MFNNEGNEAYSKEDDSSAVYFYTAGIEANCKEEELLAKLYSDRADAQFNLGEAVFVTS